MAQYIIHEESDTIAERDHELARIEQSVPWECVYEFIRSLGVNPRLNDVYVFDSETGEVYWASADPEWYEERYPAYEDEYDEPADIDDDCGFDPYLGCFTDDC
jgi:hypothetical protein